MNSVQGIQNRSRPIYLLIQPTGLGQKDTQIRKINLSNTPRLAIMPDVHQIPKIRYIQIDPNNKRPPKFILNEMLEGYTNPFSYESMEENVGKFADKLKLVEQRFNEEEPYMWKCVICNLVFEEKEALIDHSEMHKKALDQIEENVNSDQEFCIPCPVCNLIYKSKSSYANHVFAKHRPKEHSCDKCDKYYSNDYHLSLHMAEHQEDPKTYVCNVCKTFSTTETPKLLAHIVKEHVKDAFLCQECGKSFSSKTWFNDHKLFHIKDKKFFCDKCNVDFPSQRHFVVHMKKRHKIDCIGKNKCHECDLTFPFEHNLISHNRFIHTKPSLLCSVCGKCFSAQGHLTVHMKIHGEGQCVCSTCGKKFKQMKNLQVHTRIHTGERRYKCKICGKTYTQKSSLNVHHRTHSGERPYPCVNCKKGFITKTIRDNHQKFCKQ